MVRCSTPSRLSLTTTWCLLMASRPSWDTLFLSLAVQDQTQTELWVSCSALLVTVVTSRKTYCRNSHTLSCIIYNTSWATRTVSSCKQACQCTRPLPFPPTSFLSLSLSLGLKPSYLCHVWREPHKPLQCAPLRHSTDSQGYYIYVSELNIQFAIIRFSQLQPVTRYLCVIQE